MSLSIYLLNYHSVYPFICLSINLSFYLHLSFYLSLYPYLSLSLSLSHWVRTNLSPLTFTLWPSGAAFLRFLPAGSVALPGWALPHSSGGDLLSPGGRQHVCDWATGGKLWNSSGKADQTSEADQKPARRSVPLERPQRRDGHEFVWNGLQDNTLRCLHTGTHTHTHTHTLTLLDCCFLRGLVWLSVCVCVCVCVCRTSWRVRE